MHSFIRIGVAASLIAAAAFGTRARDADASVEVRPDVRIYGPTAELVDLGRWAVGRFEAAGLKAPPVEIHFHEGLSGCDGHLGLAYNGRVDLCTSLVDAPARRALLHEMGHIWLDENVELAVRTRFLELRGLTSWNVSTVPWNLRGYEHGAEVLAWALGERILTPSIPDNEPTKLARGFELLTGSPPPAYTDAGIEETPSTRKGVVRKPRTAPGGPQGTVWAASATSPRGRSIDPSDLIPHRSASILRLEGGDDMASYPWTSHTWFRPPGERRDFSELLALTIGVAVVDVGWLAVRAAKPGLPAAMRGANVSRHLARRPRARRGSRRG